MFFTEQLIGLRTLNLMQERILTSIYPTMSAPCPPSLHIKLRSGNGPLRCCVDVCFPHQVSSWCGGGEGGRA